jgi:dTDP-4-dehydrorhamnose reductase
VIKRFTDGNNEVVGIDLERDVRNANDASWAVRTFAWGSPACPSVVIHCAAMTDVDACEANGGEDAMRVNWMGTANVAAACRLWEAKMVYVSTSFVFDGGDGFRHPYREWDRTNPVNAYGLSKLMGEEAVRAHCPDHLILRTTWLYGEEGKGFPERIVEMAREGKEIRVVTDQVGDPTSCRALADAMWKALDAGAVGLFHASCSGGGCSKFELAAAALRMAGMKDDVQGLYTKDYSTEAAARRPMDSRMNCGMLASVIGTMPSWKEELSRRFSAKA